MADMLIVAAFQLGNPICLLVLVKTNDAALHCVCSIYRALSANIRLAACR